MGIATKPFVKMHGDNPYAYKVGTKVYWNNQVGTVTDIVTAKNTITGDTDTKVHIDIDGSTIRTIPQLDPHFGGIAES